MKDGTKEVKTCSFWHLSIFVKLTKRKVCFSTRMDRIVNKRQSFKDNKE
jgi:hypothetical protein